MIEIDCLGPPQVRVNGEDPPAQLLWRKNLALLVYLAHSPRARTRDHLIGLLWPDKDDAKARHSLNEALRVVRRVAGESLVTEGDNVRIKRSEVYLDTQNLDVGVGGGVFLEGFSVPDAPAFEDWVLTERERQRAQILERLVSKSNESLASGAIAAGRDAALDAIEIEPLHEPASRALMRAHALDGGRVLAIRVYERLVELLDRDLGIEPSHETTQLAERIRTERIVPGAPASDSSENDLVPVVGSGREALGTCTDVWTATLQGHPGVVVIHGLPGTGKTRIADELAARARLDGAVVAYGRALEHETAEGIWAALIKGGLLVPELGGAAPQVLAALGALEPDLFAQFPTARHEDPIPIEAEPFRQAIAAVADARPVLLVLDDAHRVDEQVLEGLGAIAERAGTSSVCVALTASTGPMAPAVDALCQRVGRDIPGKLVRTESFGEEDIDELIAWAFPDYQTDATTRLRRRVLADTGGNPFLAVELIRAIRSGFKVSEKKTQSVWPIASRTLDQTLPGDLPETIAAALRVRFRSLTKEGQAVLAAVAVLEEGVSVDTLARACELTIEKTEQSLDELEWQRWLVGDARGYVFVTRLAKQVVLADMVTGGQKRRITDRIG